MESLLAMKGAYLGIFTTPWTLVCQFSSGHQNGGDETGRKITYSRELLFALWPPATGADFSYIPCSPQRAFNATVSGSPSGKPHRKRGTCFSLMFSPFGIKWTSLRPTPDGTTSSERRASSLSLRCGWENETETRIYIELASVTLSVWITILS